MSVSPSPYRGTRRSLWYEKTKELIEQHPLDQDEIVEVVFDSWSSIFKSKIGVKRLRIGQHIFPKPQIMGFFLHELIALEFETKYPEKWRGEKVGRDKDLVYIPDPVFSIEIKTSSDSSKIFANRSYAQKESSRKKSKSGYVVAVNFQKFSKTVTSPQVRRIRFGWLDHADWIPQKAPTGQQARLDPHAEQSKLLTLYEIQKSLP